MLSLFSLLEHISADSQMSNSNLSRELNHRETTLKRRSELRTLDGKSSQSRTLYTENIPIENYLGGYLSTHKVQLVMQMALEIARECHYNVNRQRSNGIQRNRNLITLIVLIEKHSLSLIWKVQQ
ncbi:hypothetical protein NPIL_593051 [Nephila pilipes]|uniref:Uncharacterized protein n=1 Tax=Nephila pilipes TaxID=299642 RepID=A0A8X6MRS4_NEPPI|nr:hypothetical protein NPIL_593051 [Nephila pilipes]